MLQETLMELAQTDDPKLKEKIYRTLARVGMDKHTADVLVAELRKEMGVREVKQ